MQLAWQFGWDCWSQFDHRIVLVFLDAVRVGDDVGFVELQVGCVEEVHLMHLGVEWVEF